MNVTFRCPRCKGRWLLCRAPVDGRARCPRCKTRLKLISWLARVTYRSNN